MYIMTRLLAIAVPILLNVPEKPQMNNDTTPCQILDASLHITYINLKKQAKLKVSQLAVE